MWSRRRSLSVPAGRGHRGSYSRCLARRGCCGWDPCWWLPRPLRPAPLCPVPAMTQPSDIAVTHTAVCGAKAARGPTARCSDSAPTRRRTRKQQMQKPGASVARASSDLRSSPAAPADCFIFRNWRRHSESGGEGRREARALCCTEHPAPEQPGPEQPAGAGLSAPVRVSWASARAVPANRRPRDRHAPERMLMRAWTPDSRHASGENPPRAAASSRRISGSCPSTHALRRARQPHKPRHVSARCRCRFGGSECGGI